MRFISWICPLLKLRVAAPNEYIFYENDSLESIFFVKKGACDYVLPMYGNTPFVRICDDSCFGLFDIVNALLNEEDDISDLDSNSDSSDEFNSVQSHGLHMLNLHAFDPDVEVKRSFTVRSYKDSNTELMSISKKDLFSMKIEHFDEYQDLFKGSVSMLRKMIILKLYAMDTFRQ